MLSKAETGATIYAACWVRSCSLVCRVSQVLVRLLFWVTTLLFTTFIASLFLANFLDTGHCAGYLYSILGFPPSEVLLRCGPPTVYITQWRGTVCSDLGK